MFIIFFYFKLFPLLIHSLSLPDAELKLSTINTLYVISSDASKIIAEYISSLVPLLLSLTKADNGNTMVFIMYFYYFKNLLNN